MTEEKIIIKCFDAMKKSKSYLKEVEQIDSEFAEDLLPDEEDEWWMNDDSVPAKKDYEGTLKAVQDLREGKYVKWNSKIFEGLDPDFPSQEDLRKDLIEPEDLELEKE